MQRAVSILHLLVGLICGAVALPFVSLMLSAPGMTGEIVSNGQTLLLLSLLFFWPSIVVGFWGLIHFRSARPAFLAVGGLYLFLFPLGTVLGVGTLLAILPSKEDRSILPSERVRIRGLLFAMGVAGSAMVLMLWLLFRYHGDPIPQELAVLFLPAAAGFVICLSTLLRQVRWTAIPDAFAAQSLWRRNRQWQRQEKERKLMEQERIARLERDPATARYAAALKRGEYWSDEAIEYDRNPSLLVTGPAIRPIEQAMRAAGISLRRGLGATLAAHCRIDQARLYAQFPHEGRYHYTDDFHFERPCDPGEAVVISTDEMSYIHVLHPRAGDRAPIFPPPASGRPLR